MSKDKLLSKYAWSSNNWFKHINNSNNNLNHIDKSILTIKNKRNIKQLHQVVKKAKLKYLINDLHNQIEYYKKRSNDTNRKSGIYIFLGSGLANAYKKESSTFNELINRIQRNVSIGIPMSKQDFKNINKISRQFIVIKTKDYIKFLNVYIKQNIHNLKLMHKYYITNNKNKHDVAINKLLCNPLLIQSYNLYYHTHHKVSSKLNNK